MSAIAVFAIAGLTWALWRRPGSDPALAALRSLERKLARAGVVRRHSEGPQHFLRRAASALPDHAGELDYLMKCYIALRYATLEPSPESLRSLRQAVRNFHPHRML